MIMSRTASALSRSLVSLLSPAALAFAACGVASAASVNTLHAQDTTKTATTRIDFQDADTAP